MKTIGLTRWRIGLLATVLLALAGWAWGFGALPRSRAATAPAPCPGNVCAGSLTVGGQSVDYAFTQHLGPDGSLRVRLNGGDYSTAQTVAYILSGLPEFAAWSVEANPAGAVYLPEAAVNPGQTAYERRSSTGIAGQTVDMVMSVSFSGLAAGAYSFNLLVTQFGAVGAVPSLTFYVDAAAPGAGADEAFAWAAMGMGYPCADGFDNDLDYAADCADAACGGEVGDELGGHLCEAAEQTCDDEFDNDADGLADCLDAGCDGRVGEPFGAARCDYGDERGPASCGDGFDNDADGRADCLDNLATDGVGANACWKQAAYGCPAVENCLTPADDDFDESYGDDWDSGPLSGVNCQDYDCAGDGACSAREDELPGGAADDEQCFDGIDNDLNGAFDCTDGACVGVINPANTSQRCYAQEFNLGQRYNFCANDFNDDGEGGADCADGDCGGQFGSCGPCPSREDYRYDSCGDGLDNDGNGQADCSDPGCEDRLYSTQPAAWCASAEAGDTYCGDYLDNDADTLADCADPGCDGSRGPEGQTCEYPAELTCGDGRDNDADGYVDCLDVDCRGVGTCSAVGAPAAMCREVPLWSGATPFVGVDPTAFADVMVLSHAGENHALRLTGSGVYSSVTAIVGDNTDPAAYYPYADAGCSLVDTLTGAPAARFAFLAVAGHAVMVYHTAGPDIATFDLTLNCPTPGTPAAGVDFPVSLSALRAADAWPEYGDLAFSTERLEGVPPVVSGVEAEGASGGSFSVPYAGGIYAAGRRFRALAADPAPDSGVCRCELEINGSAIASGGDCRSEPVSFLDDGVAQARARAEDGAGNLSAWAGPFNFGINVTPAVTRALTMQPASSFFRDEAPAAALLAEFTTAASDTFFGAGCDVYIRNRAGLVVVNGPIGPSLTMPAIGAGNFRRCQGTVSLPTLADGMYTVSVAVTDNDGDRGETRRHAFFECNALPGPGDAEPASGCAWADFDGDGAAEGLFTSLFTSDVKACDNCVGLPNATQADINANGVGDRCEPQDEYGRCEVDRAVVCSCASDDACLYPCPGPSEGNDPVTGMPVDPQRCVMDWGLCALSGAVCFDHAECEGGPGQCADGLTSCYEDADCEAAGIGPPTFASSSCAGADRCDQLSYPWLETRHGNVYSRHKIIAADEAPSGKYNATYCVTARDTILNFASELCSAVTDEAAGLRFPAPDNAYTTLLGRIDVEGLRAGRYGEVVEVGGGDVNAAIAAYGGRLGGRVLRVTGDATVSAAVIRNGGSSGGGTVFVDGGDLRVYGDVVYEDAPAASPRALASLGWIVLDDGSGLKGNLEIDKAVGELVGAFFVGGEGGVRTVIPPDTSGANQLTVYGLMLARRFYFDRSFRSLTEGAERVIYDGRAVANPPPGFGDLGQALPRLLEAAP
jgi:hypothetical protein